MDALVKAGHAVEPCSEIHVPAIVEGNAVATRKSASADLVTIVCFWRREILIG
jgi:hypothetical protein